MIRRILKTIAIMALLLPTCGVVFAGVDRTAGVGVNSIVQEPITPGPVLDDFNDGGRLNNWGYDTGAFYWGGGFCVDSRDTTSPQEGLFCLKLDYDISALNSFAGYWSLLGGANLGGYTSISFWIKGTVGGELFKVELQNNSTNNDRNRAQVYITDYLDGGITTTWQEVTIPFHNFVNLDNWTNMKTLVFVFENYQSVTNGSPTQGTVYIDRISFGSSPASRVRIDYFGDNLGSSALGGNMGDMGNVTHTFTNMAGAYVSPPRSLESVYNVVTTAWGGHFTIFGGGANGWTEIPHDFSPYAYVSLCVKARSETENPKVVKIEIVDNAKACYALLIDITTGWQRYYIPLDHLVTNQGLDKASIKKMTIIYEDWRIQNAGGSKSGVLHIDDIRFE